MALTEALADGLREVLPWPEYEVTIRGFAISIRQCETSSSSMAIPAVMFATPGSADEKLRGALDMIAEMVKQYIAPHGMSRVEVSADTLKIWWDDPAEEGAIAQLRPISRREIGL
jgi:hypothetical protein